MQQKWHGQKKGDKVSDHVNAHEYQVQWYRETPIFRSIYPRCFNRMAAEKSNERRYSGECHNKDNCAINKANISQTWAEEALHREHQRGFSAPQSKL